MASLSRAGPADDGDIRSRSDHKAAIRQLIWIKSDKRSRIGLALKAARRSPLPWLPIAEVVADEAVRRRFRRLGLTGTRWLVAGPVYADAFAARGLELVLLTEAERGR